MAEISIDASFKLLPSVVDKSPHCGYLFDFLNISQDISTSYNHSIIFGDFNADFDTRLYDFEQILSFVELSNLYLVSFALTHYIRTSSTLLDLILDNAEKLVS